MREVARERVLAGEGVQTLLKPLRIPPAHVIKSEPANERSVKLKPHKGPAKYVPLADVSELLGRAESELMSMSPHPPDRCIAAIPVKQLASIPIVLIRTQGKEDDLADHDLKAVAEAERKRAAEASKVGDELAKLDASGRLTGEMYVEAMKLSPDASLSRQAIKLARRDGTGLALGEGVAVGQGGNGLPFEIECESTQELQIRVAGIVANSPNITARIAHAGQHGDFWSEFPDLLMDIEVLDADDKRTLMLSAYLDTVLDVEVVPTVVLARGTAKRDSVRAAIVSSLNHHEVALRALKLINEQLQFDFGDK